MEDWETILVNETGATEGIYTGLITSMSSNFSSIPMYQIVHITISQYINSSWALSWGGDKTDFSKGLCSDDIGNIYVIGFMSNIVDLNPGPGEDIYGAPDSTSVYLSKFNEYGNYIWSRVWLRDSLVLLQDVAVDENLNTYICGLFEFDLDFNPGPQSDIHTSNGNMDAFVIKFDGDGNYLWGKHWGGVSADYSEKITISNAGNILVSGYFHDSVDFDPGPGIEQRTSVQGRDIYVSKFNQNGDFLWVVTKHHDDLETTTGLALDSENNVYVSGFVIPNYYSYSYLFKSDSSGNILWDLEWHSNESINCIDLCIDISDNPILTGEFSNTVDFDPGTGVEERTSINDPNNPSDYSSDVFVCKLDSNGNFQWVYTPGTIKEDTGNVITTDESGNIFLTGTFFNYGTQESIEYISKLDPDGNPVWTRQFDIWLKNYDAEISPSGNLLFTGSFRYTIDFDPGPDEFLLSSNGMGDAFLLKLKPDGYW